jgi:hypothetical protein
MTRTTTLAVFTTPLLLATLATAAPIPHIHTATTVHWKHPDAPALPWTDAVADDWNHNHLTADPFEEFQKWSINKSWNNRTVRRASDLPKKFGHGLIEKSTPVRYDFDSTVPAAAIPVVDAGFSSWITAATAKFNAKKDPWDRLGLHFAKTDDRGEIGVRFVDALDGAYAEFTGANNLVFVKEPKASANTDAATKFIRRKGSGAAGGTSLIFDVPWSFDGDPERLADIPIEFSTDSGATWQAAVPAGFGNLKLIAGSDSNNTPAAETLFTFEMDFKTIALHEIGHAIALGHTVSTIMRADIAQAANFGNTLHTIDDNSALAVAIAYTYAVPEPTALAVFAPLALMLHRRRV